MDEVGCVGEPDREPDEDEATEWRAVDKNCVTL